MCVDCSDSGNNSFGRFDSVSYAGGDDGGCRWVMDVSLYYLVLSPSHRSSEPATREVGRESKKDQVGWLVVGEWEWRREGGFKIYRARALI